MSDLLFELSHVTVQRGEKKILRGFNLRLQPGEHVAILGPNGSGKSTLIKILTGDLYAHAGVRDSHVRLFGQEIWALEDVRRRIGIVALDLMQNLSHEVTAREITAREMILSGFFNSLGLWPHHQVTAAHERRARELLRQMEITPLAGRSLSAVSSGEQRRALIGRALVHDPEVLILDEPTNSLDPGAVREFRRWLSQLARAGRSLLLVTHQVADVIPEIERVILMKNGRIVADGPKAKLLTSARLSRLFGARLRVVRRGSQYDLVAG